MPIWLRLHKHRQWQAVTLRRPSSSQKNKPRYIFLLHSLIVWLLIKTMHGGLSLLCWRIPQTLTANLGVSPVDTREIQSFCAFLFHDIFNQWMFTGTSIQIRRFTFLSNEIFHVIVLSDLDRARILAINNIRPSASNGKCKWQSFTVVQITIILRYIRRWTFSSVMTMHSYTFSWLIKN